MNKTLNEYIEISFGRFLGADERHFTLNRTSGELRANHRLDREERATYDLVVSCSEYCDRRPHGGSSQLAHLRVRVELDDLNDHRPVFAKSLYRVGLSFVAQNKDKEEEKVEEDNSIVLSSYVRTTSFFVSLSAKVAN